VASKLCSIKNTDPIRQAKVNPSLETNKQTMFNKLDKSITYETIQVLRQQRKWQFLLICNTIYADVGGWA
jgi:hypothetical protein